MECGECQKLRRIQQNDTQLPPSYARTASTTTKAPVKKSTASLVAGVAATAHQTANVVAHGAAASVDHHVPPAVTQLPPAKASKGPGDQSRKKHKIEKDNAAILGATDCCFVMPDTTYCRVAIEGRCVKCKEYHCEEHLEACPTQPVLVVVDVGEGDERAGYKQVPWRHPVLGPQLQDALITCVIHEQAHLERSSESKTARWERVSSRKGRSNLKSSGSYARYIYCRNTMRACQSAHSRLCSSVY